MKAIAVIPARGGSKGLPGKNLRLVGGKSLVARAVRAARAARLVSQVFVSTDDEAIATAARKEGAEIIWRPAVISDDTATSESALLHALDHLKEVDGELPEALAFVQCTSPFITPADIDGTLTVILEDRADSVFAAAPFHYFVWRRDEEQRPLGVNHSGLRQRRQDRLPEYLEAGSVYAMRVDVFRREQNRFCGRQEFHLVAAERLFEIDDAADLARAQALAPLLDTQERVGFLPTRLSAIVFDFDGVFTDNGVLLNERGTEAVRCDRSDGMGIDLLHSRRVPMLVLSKERNPVVARRCEKLRLECLHGVDDKLTALKDWLAANALEPEGLVYVGNDINDRECMEFAACAVGPSDTHPDVRFCLHIALDGAGGKGAVRELADMVCRALDEQKINLLKRET